jgi:type I restriction enzyme S subunit
MTNWDSVSLDAVAEIIPGYAFKGNDFGQIGTPIVKIKDISPPKIDLTTAECIDLSKYPSKKIEKCRLQKGDFVVAMTGATIGKIGKLYDDIESFINQRVAKIQPKKYVNWDYIYYSVNSLEFYQHIQNNIDSHSAQENISGTSIGRYPLLLPPLPEQKAIAIVLCSLDDKIDLLHRQSATLEAMAEALFRQWFVVEAKEEWEEKTVGDIVEIRGGSTPKTAISEYWDGDIYWTSPRDLSTSKSIFMFETERKITEAGLAQISSGLLPVGTLLLSSRAPIGYLAISCINIAINQGYIAILNNDCITNYYMYLWCKHFMEEIKAAANGSVFQEISKSVFRSLTFVLPPENLLASFNIIIAPIFEKIHTNQTQIRTLEKLRDTLLPKLMSGEARVEY